MERKTADPRPLPGISERLREAIASRDLTHLGVVLEARARILVEFAASASPDELAEAQQDNLALAQFLSQEKLSVFSGVRRSQELQRALSQNLPIGDPRRRGTLG